MEAKPAQVVPSQNAASVVPHKQVTIRRAERTISDALNIVKLLKLGWEEAQESGTYMTRVDDFKATEHVQNMIRNALVFVAESINPAQGQGGRRIVGALGCQVVQEEWSDEWFVLQKWLFVLPKYRETGVAHQLVRALEEWSDKQNKGGGLLIYAMIEHGDQPLEKEKFFQMRGYRRAGSNFMRLPGGRQEDDSQHDSEPAADG